MSCEADIEAKCARFAEALGLVTYKLNPRGRRGAFDRVYALPNGETLWVEHKQPAGVKQRLQLHEQAKLRALGHRAVFCFTFEEFRSVLEALL